METTTASRHTSIGSYRFGPFVLDASRRLLLRGEEPVEIGPRAFDTLRVLVERAGRDVGRDDLLDAVWGDLHVTDANLTQSVSLVRKALGDSSRRPRYVATIPRRGYRFVAPVHPQPGSAPEPPVASPEPAPAARGVRPLVVGAALVAAVVVLGGALLWSRGRPLPEPLQALPGGHAALRSPSVAILPFLASGNVERAEALTLGTTERLIDRLERYPGLTVRPLRAVRSWRAARDPAAVGRLLRVEAVVEGDVARDGDHLVADVRLVETQGGAVVWSRRVQVPGGREADLPDEILRSLGPALGLEYREAHSDPVTRNPEAHEAFLRGLYHLEGRERFEEAGEWLERAVMLDPEMAEAWAGLAAVATFLDESPERGEELALRALESDPECAEAWAVLGFNRSIRQWRWREAGEDLERAVRLRPGLATAHHWLAYHYASQGRMDEALRSIRRARQIDPLSPILNADVGHLLFAAGRYDEAIEELERVLELDPEFGVTYLYLGQTYLRVGRYREAIVALERQPEQADGSMHHALLAAAYRAAGRSRDAAEMERTLGDDAGSIVRVLLAAHRIDEAATAMEAACRNRSSSVYLFRGEATFDPLRSHPRYGDILRCMGFGEEPVESGATG